MKDNNTLIAQLNSSLSDLFKNLNKSLSFEDYINEYNSSSSNLTDDIEFELLKQHNGKLFQDDPNTDDNSSNSNESKSWWSKIFDVILIIVVELIGPMIS